MFKKVKLTNKGNMPGGGRERGATRIGSINPSLHVGQTKSGATGTHVALHWWQKYRSSPDILTELG